MLSREVREAVAKGKFHIYPGDHHRRGHQPPDRRPGRRARTTTGTYPEGSINRMVVDRLTLLDGEGAGGRSAQEGQAADEPDPGRRDPGRRRGPSAGS